MRNRLFSTLAIALLGLSGVVKAQLITETLDGIIASGTDDAGLFGPANVDLAGDGFTATFSYNPAEASYTHSGGANPVDDYHAEPNTSFSEAITINAHTFAMGTSTDPTSQGSVIDSAGPGSAITLTVIVGDGNSEFLFGIPSTTLFATRQPENQTIVNTIVSTISPFNEPVVRLAVGGTLIDDMRLTDIVPTPEPGSWALFALGLVVASALSLRMRRKAVNSCPSEPAA
jgi:hypothetical protein